MISTFCQQRTRRPRLTVIDHVAQALPSGRMDSFLLFYRAVFGLLPEQLWELPDPHGLIRSRAVSSSDGSVRIALNISESRETETGRFVSAYAGAGVHHVAFATPDIKTLLAAPGATWRAISANPGELLRRPRRRNGVLKKAR